MLGLVDRYEQAMDEWSIISNSIKMKTSISVYLWYTQILSFNVYLCNNPYHQCQVHALHDEIVPMVPNFDSRHILYKLVGVMFKFIIALFIASIVSSSAFAPTRNRGVSDIFP